MRALSINPEPGSSYMDAEHVVILMQENRSFDHCFGCLQGVRGFGDPRAISLPDTKPVWLQTDDRGATYGPFRLDIKDSKVTWMGSLPHTRASQVDAFNCGKYDQWLPSKKSGNQKYASMPLTMGFYNRKDLPFNYSLADAFTICDQNFSSAMTSTTPNRSFFWTGKIIHEEDGIPKAHIRNTDYSYAKLPWLTFPELLEDNNIPWKFYQNETSCGGGFKGEERSWLANFGCNLLEFFAAYNVKFAPYYIRSLQNQVDTLPGIINKLQEASPGSEAEVRRIRAEIAKKQEVLDNATTELLQWNREKFEQLSAREKSLFSKAFTVNGSDPYYREITSLEYSEQGKPRKLTIPRGDILHQFREDVEQGKLPMVSWLAGPQNFSDHPSAPWYGAWYISEILDILTKNPKVWKKTIFIVTYDENDGYFDHVPPFTVPDARRPGQGICSAGIDTEAEYVRLAHELKQGIPPSQAREAPVGLGFRVPMIIASPWSRGGKVCSQLFDHTSTIQFLETFINQKLGKKIRLDNISEWRRTISGNLTAAFSPYDSRIPDNINFLDRDQYVEQIFNAKFKEEPNGYKEWTEPEIAKAIKNPALAAAGLQEQGIRPSCALPYEFYVEGQYDSNKKQLVLDMQAGKHFFGEQSQGAPFLVYAPGKYTDEKGSEWLRAWHFAVRAGDALRYDWPLASFEDNHYHLKVYGPNGFYREIKGHEQDPLMEVACRYEQDPISNNATGNLLIIISNRDNHKKRVVIIEDNSYRGKPIKRILAGGTSGNIVVHAGDNYGWYDISVKIEGSNEYERRYAGRVETGKESKTDPLMGGVVN